MPAGYGIQQCEQCYWQKLLKKRVEINCAAFSNKSLSNDFEDFGNWLCNTVGSKAAANNINKYLQFFLSVENKWQKIPDQKALLDHFGTQNLRSIYRVVKWLEERKGITFKEEDKLDNSEQRRIMEYLKKFNKHPEFKPYINGFHQHLLIKLENQETTIRSIRLALSPASSFLDFITHQNNKSVTQKNLDKYLFQKPGQREAISGFVKYLRSNQKIEIQLPKQNFKRTKILKRKKLEAEILKLMQKTDRDEQFLRRWLSVGLAYFHRLPKNIGYEAYDNKLFISENNGYSVKWNRKKYWIPSNAKD